MRQRSQVRTRIEFRDFEAGESGEGQNTAGALGKFGSRDVKSAMSRVVLCVMTQAPG